MRRHWRTIGAALLLAACGQRQTTPAATNAQSADNDDILTREVVTAMCDTAKERALAISGLVEGRNGSSDDVYEVAVGVAEQGCPARWRRPSEMKPR
jgi:hypothetical protein